MDWINFVEGAVSGFLGGYTVKTVINVRKSSDVSGSDVGSRTGGVTQRNNVVGGSIAGRDLTDHK